jgi:hypothetical protein
VSAFSADESKVKIHYRRTVPTMSGFYDVQAWQNRLKAGPGLDFIKGDVVVLSLERCQFICRIRQKSISKKGVYRKAASFPW